MKLPRFQGVTPTQLVFQKACQIVQETDLKRYAKGYVNQCLKTMVDKYEMSEHWQQQQRLMAIKEPHKCDVTTQQ